MGEIIQIDRLTKTFGELQAVKLNELLVRSGQSPSQLNIVSEDLEGYFLRTIQGAKGAK